MNGARKLLIFGGIALAAFGMFYGLYYAVFVEHQTLDQIGGSLSATFAHAAERNWEACESALVGYKQARYNYVRQVDVHSHWIGLAMLMIALGVAFESIHLGERVQWWLAAMMLTGSVVFPLGVILQTVHHDVFLGSALAVAGSALVTLAMAAMAWGFARASL